MPEDIEFSLPYRETYQEGLYAVLEARRAEMSRQREARITPARMAQNREAFREEFADLLGWPLNCYEAYRDQPMQVRKELQGENDFSKGFPKSIGCSLRFCPTCGFTAFSLNTRILPKRFLL